MSLQKETQLPNTNPTNLLLSCACILSFYHFMKELLLFLFKANFLRVFQIWHVKNWPYHHPLQIYSSFCGLFGCYWIAHNLPSCTSKKKKTQDSPLTWFLPYSFHPNISLVLLNRAETQFPWVCTLHVYYPHLYSHLGTHIIFNWCKWIHCYLQHYLFPIWSWEITLFSHAVFVRLVSCIQIYNLTFPPIISSPLIQPIISLAS